MTARWELSQVGRGPLIQGQSKQQRRQSPNPKLSRMTRNNVIATSLTRKTLQSADGTTYNVHVVGACVKKFDDNYAPQTFLLSVQ